MVQRSRTITIALDVVFRLLGLVPILIISSFIYLPFYDLIKNYLRYSEPGTIFISFGGLGTHLMAIEMAFVFLLGMIFGAIGKKVDYIFIATFFALISLHSFAAANVTVIVYLSFIFITVFGISVGFGLKLVRQKFLSNKI